MSPKNTQKLATCLYARLVLGEKESDGLEAPKGLAKAGQDGLLIEGLVRAPKLVGSLTDGDQCHKKGEAAAVSGWAEVKKMLSLWGSG